MQVHKCECGCGTLIFEVSDHYKRYVDQNHKQRAYRQRRKIARNAQKIVGVQRKCLNDGNIFIARTDRHVFCCDSCRVNYWQQMKRISMRESDENKIG